MIQSVIDWKFLVFGVILHQNLCRNLVYYYSFSLVCSLLTMCSNRIKLVFRKGDAKTLRTFAENIVCRTAHAKQDGSKPLKTINCLENVLSITWRCFIVNIHINVQNRTYDCSNSFFFGGKLIDNRTSLVKI